MPKITAKTLEEFNKIQEAINKLPEEIRDQIETCEQTLGMLRCNFQQRLQKYYLPKSFYSFKDMGTYYAWFTDGYTFQLSKEGDNNGIPLAFEISLK